MTRWSLSLSIVAVMDAPDEIASAVMFLVSRRPCGDWPRFLRLRGVRFPVARRASRSYCRRMKRISLFCLLALLAGGTICRADDAAVEERLNKLSGQIEDLLTAAAKQDKRISALERELENVREQAARPSGDYASREELRRLADKLQEIDRNRVADSEKFVKAIEQLGKASAAGTGGTRRPTRPTETPAEEPAKIIARIPQGPVRSPSRYHRTKRGSTD